MTSDQARELREALKLEAEGFHYADRELDVVIDAARSIALPILEGDEELVERVAEAMYNERWGRDFWRLDQVAGSIRDDWIKKAKTVLAALIPDTEKA